MAKNKKKRYELSRLKNTKDEITNKTNVEIGKEIREPKIFSAPPFTKNKEKENITQENSDDKKTFKFKMINILENKHVPIFSRFYKIFWVLQKNPKEKKKMRYHILILLGGLIIIVTALLLAILSLLGIINVDVSASGNNDVFTGVAFAVAVIVGIVI